MKHRSTHHTIPLVSDKNLRVKCEEYDNEAKEKNDNEAKVFIYGPEGYLVDVWRLHYSKDICQQVNKNIYLDEQEQPSQTQKDSEHDELTFSMMYKFSWENQRCLKRRYTVNTFPHIAKLDRGISTMTDCLGNPVVCICHMQNEDQQSHKGKMKSGLSRLWLFSLLHVKSLWINL